MQEIWKPVKDFENYEISNKGNIRSKKNGLLKPQINVFGYKSIVLYKRQKHAKTLVKSARIHRLVLQAFNPVENMDKLQVNHINYDRTDNRLENLEWTTPKQNCNRKKEKNFYYNSISCRDELGNIFYSYREAGKYYNISPNTVKRDCLGLTKRAINRMTFHK